VTDTEGGDPTVAPAPEDDPEAPEAETPAAEEPTPPARGPSRPLVVVAAALLVVATFLGVLAGRYHAELTRDRAQRRDVEELAARFSTAFVTYDYRTLDASLARIKRDATAKFGGEYERLFRTAVSPLLTRTQARSKGTVTDVFLGSVEDESANALTVVNVERDGVGGPQPVAGAYFQLDLVKQDGRWRVDNLTSINFAQSTEPAPGGTAPPATTTSVPK
jgi:Mce-associated membrane protein